MGESQTMQKHFKQAEESIWMGLNFLKEYSPTDGGALGYGVNSLNTIYRNMGRSDLEAEVMSKRNSIVQLLLLEPKSIKAKPIHVNTVHTNP